MRQTNVAQIVGEKESVIASHEGHVSYKTVTFIDCDKSGPYTLSSEFHGLQSHQKSQTQH